MNATSVRRLRLPVSCRLKPRGHLLLPKGLLGDNGLSTQTCMYAVRSLCHAWKPRDTAVS